MAQQACEVGIEDQASLQAAAPGHGSPQACNPANLAPLLTAACQPGPQVRRPAIHTGSLHPHAVWRSVSIALQGQT